ncbi:hypothetical protein JVU11DRAFT_6823 [Chiua virens]|nr:hypothetical protein JVU11DRAFT_6823 [Chiua virens]
MSSSTASGMILVARPLWYYHWTPGNVRAVSFIMVSANSTIMECMQAMLQTAKSTTPIFDTHLSKVSNDTPVLFNDDSHLSVLAQLSIADFGGPFLHYIQLQDIFGGIPPADRISTVFVNSVNIECSILGAGHLQPEVALYRHATEDHWQEDQELNGKANLTTNFASSPFREPLGITVKITTRELKDLQDWNPSNRLAKQPRLHAYAPSEWTANCYTGFAAGTPE